MEKIIVNTNLEWNKVSISLFMYNILFYLNLDMLYNFFKLEN